MGTWGPGSFENDTAIDWVSALDGGGVELVRLAIFAILEVPDDDDVEVELGEEALAAAEIVAAVAIDDPSRLSPNAAEWLASVDATGLKRLTDESAAALQRVRDASALADRWDEAGAEDWLHGLRQLERLLR